MGFRNIFEMIISLIDDDMIFNKNFIDENIKSHKKSVKFRKRNLSNLQKKRLEREHFLRDYKWMSETKGTIGKTQYDLTFIGYISYPALVQVMGFVGDNFINITYFPLRKKYRFIHEKFNSKLIGRNKLSRYIHMLEK